MTQKACGLSRTTWMRKHRIVLTPKHRRKAIRSQNKTTRVNGWFCFADSISL